MKHLLIFAGVAAILVLSVTEVASKAVPSEMDTMSTDYPATMRSKRSPQDLPPCPPPPPNGPPPPGPPPDGVPPPCMPSDMLNAGMQAAESATGQMRRKRSPQDQMGGTGMSGGGMGGVGDVGGAMSGAMDTMGKEGTDFFNKAMGMAGSVMDRARNVMG
ncbi:uncharacterized protein LOC116427054 [Nomia melanderi]|uniref:uncharacterized protein LOC116427054 n=1 Tax=Nomia melanderi TaxID=2448451 RepID=UPI003FCCEF9B